MLKLRTSPGEAPHLTVSQMFTQQRSIKDLFKKNCQWRSPIKMHMLNLNRIISAPLRAHSSVLSVRFCSAKPVKKHQSQVGTAKECKDVPEQALALVAVRSHL